MPALAHHWLVGMRGGEKVLEQFSLLFPEAEIYTLVADATRLSPRLQGHALVPSLLQRLPGGWRRYKSLLPFFPALVGQLKLRPGTSFLLSSDAAVIKGLRGGAGVPHVCYCHSPPRYLWDMQETYLRQTSGLGPLGRLAFRMVAPYVRAFDRSAAKRVDHFIANSHFVQDRIRRFYGRDSEVIHPPVSIDAFEVSRRKEDFYLIVSELAPYKRLDIAIESCRRLGRRLVIIGQGSERERLERTAGKNITFLGSQPFPVLKEHFETCRAFLFPGLEDFGITPLEAQAAGKTVIGFGAGGLLETTLDGETAVHFAEQTPASMMAAIERFEAEEGQFDPEVGRRNAGRFSPERFRREIREFLESRYPEHFVNYHWPDLP